jgi:hypothetical protein
MSKGRSSKQRRRLRAKLRELVEPFPLGYLLDEVARRLEVSGDGRISLIVRDGFVTGTEVFRLPDDDQELRRLVGLRSTNPLMRRLLDEDGSLRN